MKQQILNLWVVATSVTTNVFKQSSHAFHWCHRSWQSEKAAVQVFTWTSDASETTCSFVGGPAFSSLLFQTDFRSMQLFLTCMTWGECSRLLLTTSLYNFCISFSNSRYDPLQVKSVKPAQHVIEVSYHETSFYAFCMRGKMYFKTWQVWKSSWEEWEEVFISLLWEFIVMV